MKGCTKLLAELSAMMTICGAAEDVRADDVAAGAGTAVSVPECERSAAADGPDWLTLGSEARPWLSAVTSDCTACADAAAAGSAIRGSEILRSAAADGPDWLTLGAEAWPQLSAVTSDSTASTDVAAAGSAAYGSDIAHCAVASGSLLPAPAWTPELSAGASAEA